MYPASSVSGFILNHPDSKYFAVGNLIGITPEGRVEASPLLRMQQHAILSQQLGIGPDDKWRISLPKARNLRPDLDCLEARYKLFKEAQS